MSPTQNSISWIAVGLTAAVDLIWLTFTQTEPIGIFVFRIEPGHPFFSIYDPLKICLAVWSGGLLLAFGVFLLAYMARRIPVYDYSRGAFAYLAASLLVAAMLTLTARLSLSWVKDTAWLMYGFAVLASLREFYSRRKKAKAVSGPRPVPDQPPRERSQPPPLPRNR